jgi:hypothetical protein
LIVLIDKRACASIALLTFLLKEVPIPIQFLPLNFCLNPDSTLVGFKNNSLQN